MTLAPGTRLGSYEVLSPIGAGGMGEVYRARDTRLNRDAAIKVLPESFANDRDRLARFEREAQTLAALNHPRIATIYGLEESGSALALAMELVEGPTLAERLENGPMPAADALPLARDMADALEYAHERIGGPVGARQGRAHSQLPNSFTPDGKLLAFTQNHPSAGSDLWILPLEGDRTPRPFLQTPFNEADAAFSPDGKWLAYVSNESGVFEVYVQAFPSDGRKWQISTDGGRWPIWARNGREIFYRNRNGMMAAAVRSEPARLDNPLTVEKPRMLFEGSFEPVYSATPDERFVMIEIGSEASAPTEVHVVLDWVEELRRRIK